MRSDSHAFVLAVPSSVVRERIEGRYLTLVKSSLTDVGGGARDLVIEVHTTGAAPASDVMAGHLDIDDGVGRDVDPSTNGGGADARRQQRRRAAVGQPPLHLRRLRDRHRRTASPTPPPCRWPRRRPAPTTRCSSTATPGWARPTSCRPSPTTCSENYPAYEVRYVSTETFLNEFVDAIRTNSPAEFKKRYREVDVLLLDDIQFIEGQEGLQEEFFHTFNALHEANHQIVLSSDRPPDAIPTLEDRLRSRFKMGLITDIQPPDLETRLAILRKKAEAEPISPPPDVLEFIATHITNNIRELEGALIRVCAYASLTKEELSVELAERVLADILSRQPAPPDHPGADPADRPPRCSASASRRSSGKSRRRPLVTARQIGMYVFRELTDLSYPAIAREFGGRDHTTVIHAVEKIGALMKERRQIYDQVTELTQTIRSGG